MLEEYLSLIVCLLIYFMVGLLISEVWNLIKKEKYISLSFKKEDLRKIGGIDPAIRGYLMFFAWPLVLFSGLIEKLVDLYKGEK